MYRTLWSDKTEEETKKFMKLAFTTYTSNGKPAQINSTPTQKEFAFRFEGKEWKPEWNSCFNDGMLDETAIDASYATLVKLFINDLVSGQSEAADSALTYINIKRGGRATAAVRQLNNT